MLSVKKIIREVLAQFYGPIIFIAFSAFIKAVEIAVRPYMLKRILNNLSITNNQNVVEAIKLPIVWYCISGFVVITLFRFYNYLVEVKMMPALKVKIAEYLFRKIITYDYTFFQHNAMGSIVQSVNNLMMSIPEIIQLLFSRFFCNTVAVTIAISCLYGVGDNYFTMMLSWVAIFIIGSLLSFHSIKNWSDRWAAAHSKIMGELTNILSNIYSVKIFANQKVEEKIVSQFLKNGKQVEQKLHTTYFYVWLIYGYSFYLVQICTLIFLVRDFTVSKITVGDFALVLCLNTLIVDLLSQLTIDLANCSQHVGRVAQAIEACRWVPLSIDNSTHNHFKIDKGQIIFNGVDFAYDKKNFLFNDINLKIKAGDKVALVGRSGSGKSTFVNLVLRLFEADKGSILIDSYNIKNISRESLSKAITVVPQNISIFNRSILDNIRYGKIDARKEKVIEASKIALAHQFITSLPQGYHSIVGDQGLKLSGGQRQRIVIARALLKNTPIIILDEATNQLDADTESQIFSNLFNFMAHKTTIIISHRLLTLTKMDRIIVFEHGQIVQDATHMDLMNEEGVYKTLWKKGNMIT